MLRVACLGWGSLVWKPKKLPISTLWFSDGPIINVEFLRQSVKSQCVTLVLHLSGAPVKSLWAELSVDSVTQARRALAEREEVKERYEKRDIGHWSSGDPEPALIHGLPEWTAERKIDAVVWTALAPRYENRPVTPTQEQVVHYLRGLPDGVKGDAEKYVRCAPPQIDTPFRRRIESDLQWTPSKDAP